MRRADGQASHPCRLLLERDYQDKVALALIQECLLFVFLSLSPLIGSVDCELVSEICEDDYGGKGEKAFGGGKLIFIVIGRFH